MIPAQTAIKAALVAAVLGGSFMAGYGTKRVIANGEMAQLTAKLAEERERALRGALEESARRLDAQKELVDAANQRARAYRADVDAAATTAVSLRQYTQELAARAATCDSAAADGGATAGAPGMVLAELSRGLEERGREAAAAADAARSAGLACEQSYDSLKPPP